MLVLTRKRMEKLYIGGDICVTVVRLEGGQVRLGIEAPRHVPVVRAELRERDRLALAAARDDCGAPDREAPLRRPGRRAAPEAPEAPAGDQARGVGGCVPENRRYRP